MKKHAITSSLNLKETYLTIEDLISVIGFTWIPSLDEYAVRCYDDLITFDGSHQCVRYHCYESDITAEELLDIIPQFNYDIYDIEQEYNVKSDLYDSLSEMISDVFGY